MKDRSARDTEYMRRALGLAVRGRGCVSPNPLVGCVIVSPDDRVIGEGWHERYGEAHAEVNAVRDAERNGFSCEGATVYVTLEPCSHQGKTGPCADMLIAKKVGRCVVAMQDPYHEVDGGGIRKLQQAGIEVELGVLEPDAREVNKFFITHVTTGLPYVTMKIAMSLDGKIGLRTGKTKYISSEPSRKIVHSMRSEYDAVLVASATVIADDPELTVRLVKGRQPKRIVLDASLRVSEDAKLFSDKFSSETIVITNASVAAEKHDKVSLLASRGVTIIPIRSASEQLDLRVVLAELGKRDIGSILVEPGPTLATTLLRESMFDELVLFLAPIVLGDDARAAFGELHLPSVSRSEGLQFVGASRVEGSDDLMTIYRKPK